MLDLKYNYLNDSILLSLSELSSLRYLDLSYNRIEGSSHSRGFQWISRLTKFETLVLSGNSLKNSVLLHMRNLSFLKNLRLSDNHLEGKDYEYASYNPIAFDIANHFCEMAADYTQINPMLWIIVNIQVNLLDLIFFSFGSFF
ncbi:hypothetical protein CXB51_011158 [Gossypium anomalum]|uniref:Uncharacterized protein n=1 Tax=Gossypium anomalum TaxID=47600 RepID=A0A8J6D2X5_9ROSI|nr:hypothetical protein CXB51_011158 [Gossypium anomalum]